MSNAEAQVQGKNTLRVFSVFDHENPYKVLEAQGSSWNLIEAYRKPLVYHKNNNLFTD